MKLPSLPPNVLLESQKLSGLARSGGFPPNRAVEEGGLWVKMGKNNQYHLATLKPTEKTIGA